MGRKTIIFILLCLILYFGALITASVTDLIDINLIGNLFIFFVGQSLAFIGTTSIVEKRQYITGTLVQITGQIIAIFSLTINIWPRLSDLTLKEMIILLLAGLLLIIGYIKEIMFTRNKSKEKHNDFLWYTICGLLILIIFRFFII